VSSLLNSVPVAINAVANDAICSNLLFGSSVGMKGNNFLRFLDTTKPLDRFFLLRLSTTIRVLLNAHY